MEQTAPAGDAASPDDVVIRPLEGNAEYRACVELQRTTWGAGFSETVPPAILMAAQKVGGVTSGAFVRDAGGGERLVGFVFGITGNTGGPDGEPAHWSDMLAVHPEYRGRGLGLRLKLHQRDLLLEAGIGTVYWTFDPLEARNARLNLSRLGATASVYHRDLYGDTDSPLHAGIGTDRLVADWAIDSDRVRARLSKESAPPALADVASLPALNAPPGEAPDSPAWAGPVRVLVPSDIQALKARDPEAALAWRHGVRAALESGFDAGYRAVALVRGGGGNDGVDAYVLARGLDR